MLVMVLKNANGTDGAAFFVNIAGGEVRIISGARWGAEKECYVPAVFDVVTQTIKP